MFGYSEPNRETITAGNGIEHLLGRPWTFRSPLLGLTTPGVSVTAWQASCKSSKGYNPYICHAPVGGEDFRTRAVSYRSVFDLHATQPPLDAIAGGCLPLFSRIGHEKARM
jgi:hypothetical protein